MSEESNGPAPSPPESVAAEAEAYLANLDQRGGITPEEQAAFNAVQIEVAGAMADHGLDLNLAEGQTIDQALQISHTQLAKKRAKDKQLNSTGPTERPSDVDAELDKILSKAALKIEIDNLKRLELAMDLFHAVAEYKWDFTVEGATDLVAEITTNPSLSLEDREKYFNTLEALIGPNDFSKVMTKASEPGRIEDTHNFNQHTAETSVKQADRVMMIEDALADDFGISPGHDDFTTLADRLAFASDPDYQVATDFLQQKGIERIQHLATGMGIDKTDIDKILAHFDIQRPPDSA